jgi:hypothetical protein
LYYASFRKKYPKLRLKEELPWRKCCEIHDRAYYYGGTRDEKKAADHALKQCVAKTLNQDITGILLGSTMEIAVTIGGLPYFNTPYRWGYGEDFRNTEALPAQANDEGQYKIKKRRKLCKLIFIMQLLMWLQGCQGLNKKKLK